MKNLGRIFEQRGLTMLILVSVSLLIGSIVEQVYAVEPKNAADQFRYSVKFLCGDGSFAPNAVVPAIYKTAINVHNPSDSSGVVLFKKVVLALNESTPQEPPSPPQELKLRQDFAFEIDCKDIENIWKNRPSPPPLPPFMKGFVVITTVTHATPLDVVAVYTSKSSTNDITLDVETITPVIGITPVID